MALERVKKCTSSLAIVAAGAAGLLTLGAGGASAAILACKPIRGHGLNGPVCHCHHHVDHNHNFNQSHDHDYNRNTNVNIIVIELPSQAPSPDETGGGTPESGDADR